MIHGGDLRQCDGKARKNVAIRIYNGDAIDTFEGTEAYLKFLEQTTNY